MELEKGKLNCFFIDTELKWGKYQPSIIFMNATEEEFNRLLNNFISEIESHGREFNINFFRNYILKNGYYAYTQPNVVIPPYAPVK